MPGKKVSKSKQTPSRREAHSVDKTERLIMHRSFKLSDVAIIDNSGIPSSFKLLWETIKDTYRYRWRTFFFILSYGFWWYVLTATDTATSTAALYGAIFGMIASLAAIWMIRHREAGEKVTIRAAYYNGMVQLIPFFLVLVVMTLQLVPSSIGFFIYQITIQSGSVVTAVEQAVPVVLWLFLTMLSLFWVTATLMSMYIVTIPHTLPLEALRAGRRLVDGRRWFIMRRLLIGSLVVVVLYAGLSFWFISQKWDEALRQLVILFPMIMLPSVHTYLYKLYKSLLGKTS